MSAFATASRSIFGWVSAAVAVALIAVSASILAAPGKAYADTASHIEATGEIHVLVDGAGNAAIPNVTLRNTGSVAAYVTGCSAPAELSGWTCDAVGKRIEPGQSVQASWSGQISADTAAKLGSEAYFAGTLTYSYTDAELKATVAIDNQDPCVGDTVTASVSGLNVPEDKVTYQWYRVKDGVETAIDGAVQPAYTVADADAGCTLLCKLLSSDSICIGSVSSDATHEVKRLEAFAVYSADDGSLNFYKRSGVPAAGDTFEGKTVTKVYKGIETMTSRPWSGYASKIKTATVVDEGIQPKSTARWFYNFSNMTQCDISKLDTSNLTDPNCMFSSCSSLTSLDLSGWDTSSLTNTYCMFSYCSNLTTVGDLSGWNTSNLANTSNMFSKCSNLSSVGDLSGWNTSNVTDMGYMFSKCSKLTSTDLSNWDTSSVTNMYGLFADCSALTSLDLSGWDTSSLTNASSMFYRCASLTTLNLSSWDTSSLTNASMMFYNCKALTTLDLSGWNTSSLATASYMFSDCSNLSSVGDLSGWNTSNVTDMSGMFVRCSNLTSLDLSDWDTSNVTTMSAMFSSCSRLQEVTFGANWKWVETNGYLPTPDSTYISGADGKWYDTDGNGYAPADIPSNKAMTYYASKDLVPGITISGNAEVGETLTTTVNNLSEEEITGYQWYTVDDSSNETAIANATAHTYTVTANEVGKKILCKAFYKNGSATKNVKTTPTDNVTPQKTAYAVYSADDNSLNFYKRTSAPSAGEQFNGKTATAVYTGIETMTSRPWSGYASKIKTATVVDEGIQPKSTAQWFSVCSNMTQCDMSKLDTSSLTIASSMFSNCSSLTTLGDLSGWSTSSLTDAPEMFYGCSNLTTLDLSSWDTSKLANAFYMFYGCSSLTTIDLSSWDTSKLANASYMFSGCSSLTTIDLSGWNTSKLAKAPYMFSNCTSLTTLGDLSGWSTSSLPTASCMFNGCSSLTTLGDLSGWDTSSLTNASSMFFRCSSLTTLGDLSGWDTSSLTIASSMFYRCSNLSADCSNWDVSKVTNHYNFNKNATGVILPLAWQASSDEDGEDSAIAPLCEEQGNGDALSVPSKNYADEASSKADGEPPVDTATKGNADTPAGDADAKEEETPGDIANDNVATV